MFLDAFAHFWIHWWQLTGTEISPAIGKIIGAYEQHIYQPTLMIYGDYDMVPPSPNLEEQVSNLEVSKFPLRSLDSARKA